MKEKKLNILLIFGTFIPILCYLFYLIAYYPAMMTVDSIDQWAQIETLKFDDWHPVMHTLFNYLCTRIWYSPASIAIAQILILTFVFLSGIKVLGRIGVSKAILIVAIVLFAVYPTNGFMAVTLWKDVLYSIMLLWMTIILMKMVSTSGQWIEEKGNWLLFSANALGVLFFRHNGILTFIFVMLTLFIVFKKYYKKLIVLTIGILAVYFIVSGPVFKLMHVKQAPSTEAMGIPMQQIAAVIKYDGSMTDEQRVFFSKILPIEVWSEKYHPYITNPLKFDQTFDAGFLMKNKVKFIRHWFAVVRQNPVISAKAYLKQTSMIWKVKPLDGSFTYTVTPSIIENDFGLKSIILNSKISSYAGKILEFTTQDSMLIFFWRPALWLYLSLAAGTIIAIKTNWRSLIILGPLVSNTMAFLIATPSQDYRYQYANLLISFVLLPWAIQVLINRKNAMN